MKLAQVPLNDCAHDAMLREIGDAQTVLGIRFFAHPVVDHSIPATLSTESNVGSVSSIMIHGS
jgi:hypothetical protein